MPIILTKHKAICSSTLRQLSKTFKTSNCIKAPLVARLTSWEVISPPHKQPAPFSYRLRCLDPLRLSVTVKVSIAHHSTPTGAALTPVKSL